MYRCNECGHLFEEGEQKSWVEPHGEKMQGCPLCCGTYIESNNCRICGEPSGEEHYCKQCEEETEGKLYKLIKENFTKFEIPLINDMYDLNVK